MIATNGALPIIKLKDVSKRFVLRLNRPKSFQDMFVALFNRGALREEFWALQNINFEVHRGEAVAIIGTNGAGKSTILKLMTRILKPTTGKVTIQGKVAALLALGAGFHPELTGRENVYLNGSLLGFNRRQMDQRFAWIVDFSELDRFIDMPIRHYSSGMLVRLGFAIATSADPDILITDEVLGVGDQAFQHKCFDRLADFRRSGGTLLIVSHDLNSVRTTCDRAIWLSEGQIAADGPAAEIVDCYLGMEGGSAPHRADPTQDLSIAASTVQQLGTSPVRIAGLSTVGADHAPRKVFETGETLIARIRYTADATVGRPVFGVAIHKSDGTLVTGPNTREAGFVVPTVAGEGHVDFVIPDLPLLDGAYEFTVAIYDSEGIHPYDHHHRAYPFQVRGGIGANVGGLVLIPCEWRVPDGPGGQQQVDAPNLTRARL